MWSSMCVWHSRVEVAGCVYFSSNGIANSFHWKIILLLCLLAVSSWALSTFDWLMLDRFCIRFILANKFLTSPTRYYNAPAFIVVFGVDSRPSAAMWRRSFHLVETLTVLPIAEALHIGAATYLENAKLLLRFSPFRNLPFSCISYSLAIGRFQKQQQNAGWSDFEFLFRFMGFSCSSVTIVLIYILSLLLFL